MTWLKYGDEMTDIEDQIQIALISGFFLMFPQGSLRKFSANKILMLYNFVFQLVSVSHKMVYLLVLLML